MPICPNCGSAAARNFCPNCGQRYRPAPTLREFLRDNLEDQFGEHRKVPRTLHALFLKPGVLTREYMAGRINSYIPPFRLYLIASVLFFVLLSFLSRRSDWYEVAAREIDRENAADTTRATTSGPWLDTGNLVVNSGSRKLDQKIRANIHMLAQLPPNVAMRRVTGTMIEELPKVMFLLLPVFALLLKLLYARRRRLYVEHFVFALHLHAFAFTLFAIVLILYASWLLGVVMALAAIYTLAAMRKVYEQGWGRTFVKWSVLLLLYSILLTIGVTFALIYALAATPVA